VAVDQPDSAAALGWGTAAGVVGAVGLVAYYQALATGQTAILAPPRLQRGRAAPAARPGPGGASRPGGPGRPGRGPGRGRRDRPGRRRGGRGGPAPTWHGPPATRRRAAVPRPPCRSCSPWSRRWPSAVLRRGRPGRRRRRRQRALGRPRRPGRRPAHHPGRRPAATRPAPPGHRRPGPAVAGGPADRAQPLRRRLPRLRRDPRRPGRGQRPGLARPGGHGAARPRPHRRATQRPQTAGAALAVLGTLVVSAAQAGA
jgi:hypothetical protein